MNGDAFVDELLAFVRAAVPEAINATLYRIEGVAKERAPVRNIFAEGMTKHLRRKTAAEFAGDMMVASSMSQGGHAPNVSTMTAEHFGRSKHERSFSRGRTGTFMGTIQFGGRAIKGGTITRPLAEGHEAVTREVSFRRASNFESQSGGTRFMGHFLSARGRYEVKTARAYHAEEETIGGRLRGEIEAIVAAEWEGSQIWGYVISPTPYAKYQEFGTRHNAAHPYLRPALRESVEVYLKNLQLALAGAGSRMKGVRT